MKIAAWNPEKDLLAMVTQDHQLLVHRFNWQRLWAVSPDQRVTAICWRPDGKALAVGHHDGSIAIRDVEVRTHPFFLLTYALRKILLRESGFFM